MKKDSEILEAQYKKYKDKNGKKAKNLWFRIQNFKAFEKLLMQVNTK